MRTRSREPIVADETTVIVKPFLGAIVVKNKESNEIFLIPRDGFETSNEFNDKYCGYIPDPPMHCNEYTPRTSMQVLVVSFV